MAEQYALASGELAKQMCFLVGLDPQRVYSLKVSLSVDELVTVEAKFYPTELDQQQLQKLRRG